MKTLNLTGVLCWDKFVTTSQLLITSYLIWENLDTNDSLLVERKVCYVQPALHSYLSFENVLSKHFPMANIQLLVAG